MKRKHQRKRPVTNYFTHYRPQGDSIAAQAARAQVETNRQPISLPKLKFMDLPDPDEEERP